MQKAQNYNTVLKNEQNKERESFVVRYMWMQRNFAYCLFVTALVWFLGVGYYIENFIGWSSVMALPPVDFGLFLVYSLIPLLGLWFVIAYIDRSANLSASSALFQKYIDGLMYPDDGATKNAKAFSLVLQDQIKQLQAQNVEVFENSRKVKQDLEGQIEELSSILKLLDNYSGKTLIELNEGVKTLSDRCAFVTNKTASTITQMKNCTEEISNQSDNFVGKISPLLDEISAISANIKNNISDNKANLVDIREQLQSCADVSQEHVNSMIARTSENTVRISKAFYKTAEECEDIYKRLDKSVSGIEGSINTQKRLLETQNQLINHNSELLNNNLKNYGENITSEIDKLVKNSIDLESLTKKQINTLKAVNTETGKAIQSIGFSFDEKRVEIERRCEKAISSMQSVIIAINKETEKLEAFASLTQAKNSDLQTIAETIVDKVGDISSKLALKTDALKEKAVDVIGKFTEAGDIIAHSADKINNSSNLLLNNTKQNAMMIEEQQNNIDIALRNIDKIKERLDELQSNIKGSSIELNNLLENYETVLENKEKNIRVNPEAQKLDKEELQNLSKIIEQKLAKLNIKIDNLFAGYDRFDLWEEYLKGKTTIFTDTINTPQMKKYLQVIRKSFDDNTDFHNKAVKYLFLVDVLIKEMANGSNNVRNELINLSVKSSLDKTYFILIKALNNMD